MKLYSTYDSRSFFIQKNSTLPLLKYPLIQSLREQYDITDEMLENVAITFSMKEAETGVFQIANVPANLVINRDRPDFPDEVEYTLTYKFRLRDTKKTGRFTAEFKLDFLGDNCGKITLPNGEAINVVIGDSITKTTVV
jgi:hypothetical protein